MYKLRTWHLLSSFCHFSPFPLFPKGGAGIKKKISRVNFFAKSNLAGLTNYIIRHQPKYSNMTSLSQALCLHLTRHLTSFAHPLRWRLFKVYTLKVILCNV